jgi:hypothetical protein
MKPYTLFGREPALWLALLSSLIMITSAFFLTLTVEQQGVLNAVSVALFGLLTAFSVEKDGIQAAVLGFLKAVLAVGIAFGLHWAPDKQAIVMTLAAGIVAMFVRTQVTAPVPEVKTLNP